MIEPKGSVAVAREVGVTDGQARKTALVVAPVLLAIAAWNLYRGRMAVVLIFGAVGVVLLFVGLLAPSGLSNGRSSLQNIV